MKGVDKAFAVGYGGIALLFFCCALSLVAFAGAELWSGVRLRTGVPPQERVNAVLESVGLLTVAVAALELGQTVIEEEIKRDAQLSAPTRARRFLSRFLIVVVVALSVETLVAVFRFVHEDPSQLPRAAAIGVAAAALLAAWGVFVRLNRSAEELEPEAMEEVKREDRAVK